MTDIATIIVSAVVLGAASGLKRTAETAVRDAYDRLKVFINQHYPGVDLGVIEAKPASESRRTVLKEEIVEAGLADNSEVLPLANAVLIAVRTHDPELPKSVGVAIEDIECDSLSIEGVRSAGDGVDVGRIRAKGDVKIRDIDAGRGDVHPKA